MPTVIVVYTLVIILGIGLCFCLRKANRLVPNKYSFPMMLRSSGNRAQQWTERDELEDEESRQGLLNDFEDQDDMEDDEQVYAQRHNPVITTNIKTSNRPDDNDDSDGFGDLQTVSNKTSNAFVVSMDDDEMDDDDNVNGQSINTQVKKSV
ncbi:uncharacterized protein BX664DRAFT_195522 [Halteromyces radiatus]|uniref:uncharacterized protein n=1 Tax=Halteromyces radiatus TaxID=101107 RepID=UPI002220E6F9|nr:uncharacterized protein BX664DRAFT_195522 [Halteromyces radiatus]KAI8081520.1 hypothetical protein BX664DRAFT_195522 [Halteromyces radiatus]